MLPLQSTVGADGLAAVEVALVLAYLTVIVGASVLLYYLLVYVRRVLAEPYRERWWYLGVGVGAAVVYGVAGLAEVLTTFAPAAAFKVGATLFFFLFIAVGVRAMYSLQRRRKDDRGPAMWIVYLVIGGFVVAWWATFLLGQGSLVAAVETIGLTIATVYTLGYAVLTVRASEGTSISAVVRQLLPALVCFAGVVVAEQAGIYLGLPESIVTGVELVGTALVGAFLFTTAVAMRQESGEVQRMYDRTTWRQEEVR
jgi:hypothetical protein